MSIRRSVAPFAAAIAFAPAANGEADRWPQLEYSAPPSCPTKQAFLTRLREHDVARAEVPIVVTIAPGQGAFRGRATITSGRRTALRDVEATECADVAEALAFVLAVALEELAAPPLSTAAPSSAVPVEPPPVPARAPPPPPEPSRALRVAVGAQVGAQGALAPDVSPTVGAFFDATWQRVGAFAPSVRLLFEGARAPVVDVGTESARFTFLGASTYACPVRFGESLGTITLRPCVLAQVGVLSAAAEGAPSVRTETRAWWAMGAVARGRWDFAPPVGLEIELGALAPITRDRFLFQPATVVHDVPAVGGLARFGVVFEF
jgi:hypothetical protein